MLRNRLDIQLRNVRLIFRVYGWLQSLWTPWTPCAPPLEPLEYTAESRDRTGSQHDIQCSEPLEDRSAALGSSRCELPGMHSVLKSAVLPYASGVGGLSRRLLNRATPYVAAAGHSPSSAADPASSDLRFSPGALGDAQLPETRCCRKSPPQERISSAPGRPPEKHHEHRFAQHPHSKIQRANVRLLGGYLRQE